MFASRLVHCGRAGSLRTRVRSHRNSKCRCGRRPFFELLEDRRPSATFVANSFLDATPSEISNATISVNNAVAAGGGPHFSAGEDGYTLEVVSSTIAHNSAAYGGDVVRASGSLLTKNSILAGNSALIENPDVQGTLFSLGHNLIGDVGSAQRLVNGRNGDQVGGNESPMIDARLELGRRSAEALTLFAKLSGAPILPLSSRSRTPYFHLQEFQT